MYRHAGAEASADHRFQMFETRIGSQIGRMLWMNHSIDRFWGGAMLNRAIRPQSERLWTHVMREGRAVEDVAREYALSRTRVERLLIALGRRKASLLRDDRAP